MPLRCVEEGCDKYPRYNYLGNKAGIRCRSHKLSDMIDVRNRICVFEGCTTQSSFNLPGLPAKYCSKHKTNDMIALNKIPCQQPGCITTATFGLPGDKPTYCLTHKVDDMINIHARRCVVDNCTIQPSYGFIGQQATFCRKHAPENTHNVNAPRCTFDGCVNIASYGEKGSRPIFCAKHAPDNLINTIIGKCISPGCNTFPSFGYDGSPPKYCVKHAEKDMKNIRSKKCQEEGCDNLANYNYPDQLRKLYCVKHAKPDMIFMRSGCKILGCTARPSHGLPGMPISYCKLHSSPEMVSKNKSKKKCEQCDKLAYYSSPGQPKTRCNTHKLVGDIRTYANCAFKGCDKTPVFNHIGTRKGLYCAVHKGENMINVVVRRCNQDGCVTVAVNKVNGEMFCNLHTPADKKIIKNKCAQEGCNSKANYGIDKVTHCKKHSTIEMRRLSSKCAFDGCNKTPSFGVFGETKRTHCAQHKLPGMVGLYGKSRCLTCQKPATHGQPKKRPTHCAEHAQPEAVQLTKTLCDVLNCKKPSVFTDNEGKFCAVHAAKYENAIKRACKYCDILENSEYVCNLCKSIRCKKEFGIIRHMRKVIQTPFEYNSSSMLQGCSKKRPDAFFDLPEHCVIVEIDEFQHKQYAEECECARINEIVTAIGGRPVVIIRFNPDKFTHNGTSMNVTWQDRIPFLMDIIRQEIMRQHDRICVEVIQLYFDVIGDYTPIQREDITQRVMI